VKNAAIFALKTGKQLAKAGYEVGNFKSTLNNAAREPVAAAKRAIRKTRYATEDFVNEVIVVVRKQPLKSLCITFGFAFGIGALAGWFGKRR
jgi:hypothetical protein